MNHNQSQHPFSVIWLPISDPLQFFSSWSKFPSLMKNDTLHSFISLKNSYVFFSAPFPRYSGSVTCSCRDDLSLNFGVMSPSWFERVDYAKNLWPSVPWYYIPGNDNEGSKKRTEESSVNIHSNLDVFTLFVLSLGLFIYEISL